jgi:hypothetical protein
MLDDFYTDTVTFYRYDDVEQDAGVYDRVLDTSFPGINVAIYQNNDKETKNNDMLNQGKLFDAYFIADQGYVPNSKKDTIKYNGTEYQIISVLDFSNNKVNIINGFYSIQFLKT